MKSDPRPERLAPRSGFQLMNPFRERLRSPAAPIPQIVSFGIAKMFVATCGIEFAIASDRTIGPFGMIA